MQLGSTVARQNPDFDSDVVPESNLIQILVEPRNIESAVFILNMARYSKTKCKLLQIKFLQDSRRRRVELQQKILFLLEARRMWLLRIFVLTTLLISSEKAVAARSCRRLQRNNGWFDHVWNTYIETRFKKTFRVSKETFNFILSRIEHDLQRDTVPEDPIPPAFRLAVCLYHLARGDYFYTIAEMTGLGNSTVCGIVSEVTKAIVNNLWSDQVTRHFPRNEEEFQEKILDVEELRQFPCSWAAIDGCHIPLKCPAGGLQANKENHKFKHFSSIVLMGMVDARLRFVWASCGFPGNSHDSVIFQSTNLWSKITRGQTIPDIGKDVEGVNVPPLILGDSAFSFQSWLMKPYTSAVLTSSQQYFNYRLSRARMSIEEAYGELKGRWRILQRKCESAQEEVRDNTLACIVLHNICIERGETLCRQIDGIVDAATNQRRLRDIIRRLLNMTNCHPIRDTYHQATRIRNVLTQELWRENQRYGVL